VALLSPQTAVFTVRRPYTAYLILASSWPACGPWPYPGERSRRQSQTAHTAAHHNAWGAPRKRRLGTRRPARGQRGDQRAATRADKAPQQAQPKRQQPSPRNRKQPAATSPSAPRRHAQPPCPASCDHTPAAVRLRRETVGPNRSSTAQLGAAGSACITAVKSSSPFACMASWLCATSRVALSRAFSKSFSRTCS